MKKQEIIKETQDICNEFLEHSDLLMNGNNWNKSRLEKRLNSFREMLSLIRKSRELRKDFDREKKLYFALYGGDANYDEGLRLAHEAEIIWLAKY